LSSCANATLRRAVVPKGRAGPRETKPLRASSWDQYGLVDPGDVAEVAAQAFDLADHRGLAGLEIDRIEGTTGDEPALVLVLDGRNDVERDGAAHRNAGRSLRFEHAVIVARLG